MNDSWHIPRASLNGSNPSSSNSSSKSNSNPPTVTRHSARIRQEHSNLPYIHNETPSRKTSKSKENDQMYNKNRHNGRPGENIIGGPASVNSQGDRFPKGLKRGSRSSQGSTDSNRSNHSASSGSMLLTAANLERFVAIHNKNHLSNEYPNSIDPRIQKNYSSNLAISTNPDHYPYASTERADTVIGIDPNLHFVKTKEVDSVSIASSTHFTMVNGIGGSSKNVKEGICGRGHQITILILSMSTLFLIGILAMVYLLEMRARVMPH